MRFSVTLFPREIYGFSVQAPAEGSSPALCLRRIPVPVFFRFSPKITVVILRL